MKLLKKLKNLILLLLAFMFAFVIICAINPELSLKLGQIVKELKSKISNGGEDTTGGISISGGNIYISVTDGDINQITYVVPSGNDLDVPDNLSEKNGYTPVVENNQEIDDSQVDSTLQTGSSGDNYEFDSLYYPYYNMLNDVQKQLYKQIYANALECNDKFAPISTIAYSNVKDTFEAVCNDHPELFWLETEYSCKYKKNGEVAELTLKYNSTADNLEDSKNKFEAAANEIISSVKNAGDDVAIERLVHDALIDRVEYDENASMSQSSYSALVNGKTVCAGYARAFQYICMELDIPTYYCTGYAGESHAWDIVKLDDGYTNVDVTWDDTDPATNDYFNKSDKVYSNTHIRTDLSVNIPACLIYDDAEVYGDEDNNATATETSVSGDDEIVYINPNPTKPLRLQDENSGDNTDGTLNKNNDIDTLEEYFNQCKQKLVEAGKGRKQFEVIISEKLWNEIEQAYSNNSYKAGYVNDALKELGGTNFQIEISGKRLGNGYYELYHYVATW